MKKFLFFLFSFSAHAFSPQEYYIDIASEDQDYVVFENMSLKHRIGKVEREKVNSFLKIHAEDGSVLEFGIGNDEFDFRKKSLFYLNGVPVCRPVFYKEGFSMKDSCKVDYIHESFPVKYMKSRYFDMEEGKRRKDFAPSKEYNYFPVMPFTEIKDQKIYTEYKGKKFWIDLEELPGIRDINILYSKKTKKKLWKEFFKNDLGFVEFYKKIVKCNEDLRVAIRVKNDKEEYKKNLEVCHKINNAKKFIYLFVEIENLIGYENLVYKTYHPSNAIMKNPTKSVLNDAIFPPDLSETDYFEYRPYNLPYFYGDGHSNFRVVVHLKKETSHRSTNRLTFAYYDKAWHLLTYNDFYPHPGR